PFACSRTLQATQVPEPWQEGQRYSALQCMSALHFLFSQRALSTSVGSWQFGQKTCTERVSFSLAVRGMPPRKRTSPSCLPPPQAASNATEIRTAACLSFIGISSVCPPLYPRG